MADEISIIIPVKNEAETLTMLVEHLTEVLTGMQRTFEIVFVDDGSNDTTLEVLQELQRSNNSLVIVELIKNQGQTAALAAGIEYAQYPLIVTMDGDLQHSPTDIPKLLAPLGDKYDMVLGWRSTRTDGLLLRRVPSKIANYLMRHISGIAIKDFGTAFRAAKASVLKDLELFGELHRFVPVLAIRNGARIKEVPIVVHPRVAGKSKYGISRTIGVLQDLLFLEFYLNYLTKPMRAFGKIAAICLITGVLISLLLVSLVLIGLIPSVLEHGALLLFSVFLMIVGVQLLGTGILAELIARLLHCSSEKKIFSVRRVHRVTKSDIAKSCVELQE